MPRNVGMPYSLRGAQEHMVLKVVLVNPPGNVLIDEHLEPPLGLLSIASFLEWQTGVRATVLET